MVEEVFTGREADQAHVINLVGEPETSQETKVVSVMGGLGNVQESVFRRRLSAPKR